LQSRDIGLLVDIETVLDLLDAGRALHCGEKVSELIGEYRPS
jgi:hypothetical protein